MAAICKYMNPIAYIVDRYTCKRFFGVRSHTSFSVVCFWLTAVEISLNILAYCRSQDRANGPPENQMIDTVQARRQTTLRTVASQSQRQALVECYPSHKKKASLLALPCLLVPSHLSLAFPCLLPPNKYPSSPATSPSLLPLSLSSKSVLGTASSSSSSSPATLCERISPRPPLGIDASYCDCALKSIYLLVHYYYFLIRV